MKERIKSISGSFFVSVTLINLAMLILGMIIRPEQRFGYEVFLYPLIYGLIGIIPALIAKEGRELTVRQAVIKHVMQMIMTVVLILAFMFAGKPMNRDSLLAATGVAASVVIIYAMVILIGWFLDLKNARIMTEDLKRFQSAHGIKREG